MIVKPLNQNKMKKTAVEFLLSHIWTTDWVNYTREEKINVINQAKAMEKEQIVDAWDNGFEEMPYKNGQHYYNETFKSE